MKSLLKESLFQRTKKRSQAPSMERDTEAALDHGQDQPQRRKKKHHKKPYPKKVLASLEAQNEPLVNLVPEKIVHHLEEGLDLTHEGGTVLGGAPGLIQGDVNLDHDPSRGQGANLGPTLRRGFKDPALARVDGQSQGLRDADVPDLVRLCGCVGLGRDLVLNTDSRDPDLRGPVLVEGHALLGGADAQGPGLGPITGDLCLVPEGHCLGPIGGPEGLAPGPLLSSGDQDQGLS